jgi:hypothetical protein
MGFNSGLKGLKSNWYSLALCLLATAAASKHKLITYTICCLCTVYLTDDEQQACSKHVEAYYNKLTENSASFWFTL